MTLLIHLLHNRRASASVEFAFVSLFLFGIISVALDFGVHAQQRLRLANAVQQGAVLAYNQQVGSDLSAIKTYVAAAAHTQNKPTVTAGCNGTTACGDGKCSCIDASGGFAPAQDCNTPCPGSSAISGNYLKISAEMPYKAVIVPNKWVNGSKITASTVVRLQ